MTILDDIVAKVYTITNRPDLDVETLQGIQRALNYAHFGRPQIPGSGIGFSSDFSFDLQEGVNPIPIDLATGTNATHFLISLPNRFRKFKYLYCDPPVLNSSNGGLIQSGNKALTEVTPKALFDRNSLLNQQDCYYIAGTNVVIRTSVARSNLYWGYYQTPSLVDSFIAVNFSDVIAWKAAAEIFSMLDDTKKTYYESLTAQQILELQSSYHQI